MRIAILVGVPTPLNAFVLALLRRMADGGRFLTARGIERAFERESGPRHAAKQAA